MLIKKDDRIIRILETMGDHKLIINCSQQSMENAKAKGKKIGRPQTTREDIPAVFFRHYPSFAAGKMNVSELARVCGLSRPTVYKYLKMIA